MKPRRPAPGATPAPAIAFRPTLIPQGGGSYLVQPGKPVSRLAPREFGACFSVSPRSIYRWINDGTIPDSLIERAGKRKIVILAEAVDVLRRYFRAAREDEDGPLFRCGSTSARRLALVNGFVIARPAEGKPILIEAAVWERDWRPVSPTPRAL